MDKQIVIVVPSEVAAYEVVKALKALDDEGSIELYTSTVVMKSADQTFAIKDRHHARGAWAAALGASTGALIGLLAGPAGAAAGAAIGGSAGVGAGLAYSGFAGDFVHDVAASMKPGSYAVCASVWEEWTIPIDNAMAPLGASVFRQATDDIVAAQIKSDWQAMENDLARLDAEILHALGEEKAKLQAKREELRQKQAARRERLEQRARELDASWSAKMESIAAKTEEAAAKAKARHQEHAERVSRFVATQKKAFRDLFA